jgi:hypothetical protein
MGAQIGALFRAVGGYEAATAFYPVMASRMLALGLPHHIRRPSEKAFRVVLSGLARRMHTHRRKLFPQYVARTDAKLASANLSKDVGASLLVMEVLQNTVGLLGKLGVLRLPELSPVAIPACTSVATWGASSRDGTLRHARNFDFPGAGVWDHAPALLFCHPDEGHRYGFATTRGVDVPGITAFNEHGLTLTVHTRFHREVRFDGAPVFDLGHEIVRRASTLAEAVDVARKVGAASTWGILVSSAKERSACLIETTGERVAVSEPLSGRSYQACTNRYVARHLQEGEVTTSRAFVRDSDARLARVDSALREANVGFDAEALSLLLCDLSAEGMRDGGDDTARLAGDCIVSPICVQSVVLEPEHERINISVGRAPTCFGPYLTVPLDFHGRIEVREVYAQQAPTGRSHRGNPLGVEDLRAVHAYVDLARKHIEGAAPEVIRQDAEDLVSSAPNEPNFRFIAALLAVQAQDFSRATHHLEVALRHEYGEARRARCLLFLTRVLAVRGESESLERARAELFAMTGESVAAERHALTLEANRPLSRRQLAHLVVDFLVLDAVVPGASA